MLIRIHNYMEGDEQSDYISVHTQKTTDGPPKFKLIENDTVALKWDVEKDDYAEVWLTTEDIPWIKNVLEVLETETN